MPSRYVCVLCRGVSNCCSRSTEFVDFSSSRLAISENRQRIHTLVLCSHLLRDIAARFFLLRIATSPNHIPTEIFYIFSKLNLSQSDYSLICSFSFNIATEQE